MNTLVHVPWQPGYYSTPDTLALLERASAIAGHNIIIDDAWRSYAEQAYYYNGWINRLPGFNVASNPDTGQRNHMRGDAFDIKYQADRAAMLAAGFTPDSVEWWHFNNPNWMRDPIIPSLLSAAVSYNTYLDTPTITPERLPLNIVCYLYVPTNSILLVDHLARTIRNLGNVASDPVRDYYSRQPYVKAYDQGDNRRNANNGEVYWQEVVQATKSVPNGVYTYI